MTARRTNQEANIKELLQQLPPDLLQEAQDFIEYLLNKRTQRAGKPPSQNWAGALKDFREKYTSLDLQKHALEWRED